MKQHSPQFLNLVAKAKNQVEEITVATLKSKIDSDEDLYLIDVREDHEWSAGHIPTAIHIGKGIIERDIEKTIPDAQAPIVVYCSGGFRSALVAQTLKDMGYSHVLSLNKGSKGWQEEGYKLTSSQSPRNFK